MEGNCKSNHYSDCNFNYYSAHHQRLCNGAAVGDDRRGHAEWCASSLELTQLSMNDIAMAEIAQYHTQQKQQARMYLHPWFRLARIWLVHKQQFRLRNPNATTMQMEEDISRALAITI